ncbi:SAM hydrolase/SAM-dependent halogenase family protein [Sedimenticola sp.]
MAMTDTPQLVALFTDFGIGSHYLAQVKARLLQMNVTQPVIELCSDAPAFNPRASAYLLASFLPYMPDGTLFICVVDPEVGGGREAVWLKTERFWFVGPDNGLLSQAARHSQQVMAQRIDLPDLPAHAKTFDGRDLFAPAAARICTGSIPKGRVIAPDHLVGADWPENLAEVIYIDAYGNAVTGLAAGNLPKEQVLLVNGHQLPYAETFCSVPKGMVFWYENANGLVEIAANQGSAKASLTLEVGCPVRWADT